jgi:Family of unknown function (DUF6326)
MAVPAKLSALWTFVLFNMIYADLLSLMDPRSPIRSVMNGASLPPGGLLAGAILMETPIAMVFVSRVLKRQTNRWANIVLAPLNVVAVIAGGQGRPYYIWFAALEVMCLSLIVWYAWTWPDSEVSAECP